ncbi:GPI anchored serine-threonine rich family protein [Aspergillus fischeri NRRL 181]|uniref:GPI anchored protein, putative n=1 Tax=Neosartorya fischeri (strain ATCC 1020 / DSM 3700 / CBS 544.65 / FGSC A1164 / JCM 1740 / NRRL 181 / WB 181) TaxID=331117 RepID=A1DB47_NEOFI|nr:GPI anchored protein, putative [Aspergillus fischeri NRRL 181]EAW20087.1 GPI anchored protein, putative [Aspergillus fischeri NRRL 181]KAG2000845.1 hypothetical protein GB937_010777 [Aspergillus fischeri]
MRSIIFLSLSALAAIAAAATKENAFNIPANGYQFSAGEPTTLTWDPTTSGTVTLKLQWGDVFTPDSGSTIVSSIPNSGSYTWNVPSSIASRPDYTVEIISDDDTSQTNYLNRFTIAGATGVASSTATATSTKTASTKSTSTTTSGTPTMTTVTSTTASPSSSPSTTSSSSTTETSTTTTQASRTTATTSPTSVPNANGGIINRISGGMMALVMGVIAFM